MLRLDIPWQRVLSTRGIRLTAGCEEACRLVAHARGAATVPPRIVIVTAKRAARHRAAHGRRGARVRGCGPGPPAPRP